MTGEQLDAGRQIALSSLRRRFPRVDRAILEDASQFGALICWRDRERIDDDCANYLFVVAYRHVLAHLRHKSTSTMSLDYAETPDGAPLVERIGSGGDFDALLEARERLRAIDDLPARQRTAVTARLLGLSYEQATDATGHTYTWFNKHLTRGRAALHEAVAA